MTKEQQVIMDDLKNYIYETTCKHYIGEKVNIECVQNALNEMFSAWHPNVTVSGGSLDPENNTMTFNLLISPPLEVNFIVDNDGNVVFNNEKENKNGN